MKDLTAARRELNGVIAFISVCKLFLVFFNILFWSLLYRFLQYLCGDGAWKAYMEFFSYGTVSGLLIEISIALLCLGVPICCYFFFSRKKLSVVIPSEKPELLAVCYGVGASVIAGNVASNIGSILLEILFRIFGLQDKYYAMLESDIDYPTNIWLVPLFAIVLAVLPGLLEEVSMRGIALSATKKYGILFSLFFSGFFFSFMHSSWTQLPFTFVLGIVFAYFTLRFKTIWIAVISHFVFNFNSVVQLLILQNGGKYATIFALIWSLLFTTLMLGLFIAGLIVYGVTRPDVPKSEYSAGEKMKILFSSPFLYVFIVLELIQLIYLLIAY